MRACLLLGREIDTREGIARELLTENTWVFCFFGTGCDWGKKNKYYFVGLKKYVSPCLPKTVL